MNRPYKNIAHPLLVILFGFIGFLCAASHSLMSQQFSLLFFYFANLIVGITAISFIKEKAEKSNIYGLFFLAYSINIIFVFIFFYYFNSVGSNGFLPAIGFNIPDDKKFYAVGVALSEALTNETAKNRILLGFKYIGYPYFLAGIYFISDLLGDHSILAPRMVNAAFGGLIIVLIFLLAKKIYGGKTARTAVIISFFFSSFIYYSSLILRDIIISFFVILFIYSLVHIVENNKFKPSKYLFLALAALCSLYYLRTPTAYALLFSCAIFFCIFYKKISVRLLLLSTVTIFFLYSYFTGSFIFDAQVSNISDQATRWSRGLESAGDRGSLAVKYIYNAPYGLSHVLTTLYTMLMPIPPIKTFMLHHITQGIGSLLWYFLCPFWLIGMYQSRKISTANLLSITSIIILLGVAYIQADIRHKMQFLGLAMVQTAYGIHMAGNKSKLIASLTGIFLLLLLALYILLKFRS